MKRKAVRLSSADAGQLSECFAATGEMVRLISSRFDELKLIFRAFDVLETKQRVQHWFNTVLPALGARPIDLLQTAKGRRAVLRELGRIGSWDEVMADVRKARAKGKPFRANPILAERKKRNFGRNVK